MAILLFTSSSDVGYKPTHSLMEQIEPYRQIVQLQSEIVKISARNADLKRKCSDLEVELTRKRVMQECEPISAPAPELVQQPATVITTFTRYASRVIEFLRPPGNQPA